MTRQAQYHSISKLLMWAAFDAVIWCASLLAAQWFRFDFDVARLGDEHLPRLIVAAVIVQLLVGFSAGPYRTRQVWGSFEETLDIMRAGVCAGVVVAVWDIAQGGPVPMVPRSVPIVATFLAVIGMFAGRFIKRSYDSRRFRAGDEAKRVLIFGAGPLSVRIVQSMGRDPESRYARAARAARARRASAASSMSGTPSSASPGSRLL